MCIRCPSVSVTFWVVGLRLGVLGIRYFVLPFCSFFVDAVRDAVYSYARGEMGLDRIRLIGEA